jgi:hypothetical protein
MGKRKNPSLSEKLAAACLQLAPWGAGSREEAKAMTAKEILARYECQHEVAVDHGGTNHPTNLTMMPKEQHRRITNEIDIRRIAKAKRLEAKRPEIAQMRHEEIVRQNRVMGYTYDTIGAYADRPNRPKRKMQGRGFQGHRRFDGTIVRKPRQRTPNR